MTTSDGVVCENGGFVPDGGGRGKSAGWVGGQTQLPTSVIKSSTDDDSGGDCGWLCLTSGFLQRFRTPAWVLFFLCCFATVQGLVVNGFVNVSITSLERRFDLRSTETGLVAGMYDIATVLCMIPVTYFGGRPGASKPRWLGFGAFIMGLGSIVFTIPHFASGLYEASEETDPLTCPLSLNMTSPSCDGTSQRRSPASRFWYVFLLGQALHGIGATPLYTLGITFIDECVKTKMSSMYLGIFYTMSIVGPALGFVGGGAILNIYTDFHEVKPNMYGLTPDSKVWVGAWWLGFLLAGILFIIISIPVSSFPAKLPGARAIRAAKVSETHGGTSDMLAFTQLRQLPAAVKVLLRNPTFLFLSLAAASEGIILSGFSTFLPKLLENQFSLSTKWAAILVGCVMVPAGGGGMFMGGWLVKRFDLRCAAIIRFCGLASVASLLCTLVLLSSCDNLPFAGITQPYKNNSDLDLGSSCNLNCKCSRSVYDPVCGRDGVMYYSPCHAGCRSARQHEQTKTYTSCSCVSTLDPPPLSWQEEELPTDVAAVRRKCSSNCPWLPLILGVAFPLIFFIFMTSTPAVTATIRCVRESDRSFAMGLQSITMRVLGTIPGPMLFGLLIDLTCIFWQESCGTEGSCRVYDNYYMARYMLAIAIVAKFCSTFSFFLALLFYRSPPVPVVPQPQGHENVAVDHTRMDDL